MTRPVPSRSPLRSLVAHPLIVLLLVSLGAAGGIMVARAMPLTYTAEARLAVVSATNNAYSIPGYPLAARELASDYSRWVQNNAAGGTWSPPGAVSVSASPIPESAVIRVEVSARTPEQATQGAQQVSATLLRTVAEAQQRHDPERAFADFSKQAPGVALARAKVQEDETAYSRLVGAKAPPAQIRAAATTLRTARVALAELELRMNAAASLYQRLYVDTQGASTLKQIVPAALVGSPERTALMRFGVLGAAGGLLCALLVVVPLDRRRGRRATGGQAPASPTDGAATQESAPRQAPPEHVAPAAAERGHGHRRRAQVDTR